MYALWKSDWSDHLMALYEISPKIVHFALSRHQARNLKIRIHVMKDNINAVILIPKVWRSDHPRDRSSLRKILRLKISKWIYPRKIAWAGKIFRYCAIIRTCSFTWASQNKFSTTPYKSPVLFRPSANIAWKKYIFVPKWLVFELCIVII